MQCPVCAYDPVQTVDRRGEDAFDVACPRCGTFAIEHELSEAVTVGGYSQNFPIPPHQLSGILRHASERGELVKLAPQNIEHVIAQRPVPTDIDAILAGLLLYLGSKAADLDAYVQFDPDADRAIVYGKDVVAGRRRLADLEEEKLVEIHQARQRITAKGWRRIRELRAAPGTIAKGAPSSDHLLQEAKHFELGERLGSGRDAKVFRARDTRLHSDVAIKFFDASKAIEELVVEHARVMAAIRQHPNIVVVYEAARIQHPEGGQVAPAIVMELVEGVVLLDKLGSANAPEEVRRIGLGLLAGIEAYHANDLAHGDLHEENAMVGPTTVKLLDPARFTESSRASTRTLKAAQQGDLLAVQSLLRQLLHASTLDPQRAEDFRLQCRHQDLATTQRLFVEALEPRIPSAADTVAREVDRPPLTALQQLRQHRDRLTTIDPTGWSEVQAWHTEVRPLVQVHFPAHLHDFDRLGRVARVTAGVTDQPYKRTLGWLNAFNQHNAKTERDTYVELQKLIDGILAAYELAVG